MLFVMLKSKLVDFSVNASHIQCTELDTLQRVTKYSSTRRQKEGRLMILRAVTSGKTLLLLKGTAWARTTVLHSLLGVGV